MIVMMPKLLNERTALDVGVQCPDGRIWEPVADVEHREEQNEPVKVRRHGKWLLKPKELDHLKSILW